MPSPLLPPTFDCRSIPVVPVAVPLAVAGLGGGADDLRQGLVPRHARHMAGLHAVLVPQAAQPQAYSDAGS